MKSYRKLLWFLPLFCLLIAGIEPSFVHAAATITVVNNDGAGEGFNDPTPFTPVGGNNAATLGQARLNAFQHAAAIWADLITSSVPIQVDAQIDPLPFGVLGSAGPNTVHRDFPNAPQSNTWYVQALANKLEEIDVSPTTSDINATFTSLEPIVPGITWYLGLDGSPPANQIDFVTVVLHEIGHGLGFLSLVDVETGSKFFGFDDVYSDFLEHHGASPSDYLSMSNNQRALANVAGTNLHFIGPQVVGASGRLTGGVTGNHVQMYAPNPVEPGSSVSHFSNVIKPDQLMEPGVSAGVAIHDVGLTWELFHDIGWIDEATSPPEITSPEPTSTLASSTETFTYTANGTAVTEWWLYVGTSEGAADLHDSNSLGTATSHEVSGLPTDSSPVHVRLWYKVAGTWLSRDFRYTAAPPIVGNDPDIVTPSPNSVLAGASETFVYTANGTAVTEWWLYVGTSEGAADLHDSNSLGTATSHEVSGLPTDSSPVHVRLWYKVAGTWLSRDFRYTAAPPIVGNDPDIVTPSPNSVLAGASETFVYTANGTAVTEWWLYVGTSEGAADLHDSNSLGTATSHEVSGLPTDSSPFHVRLWYKVAGTWLSRDFRYTAAPPIVGNDPDIVTPSPNSVLAGASETFVYTANGTAVTEWWLYVGTSEGAADLHDSNSLGTATSHEVSGLPTDSSPVHVRLWYKVAGTWLSRDFRYTAAPPIVGNDPDIVTPSPNSVLAGASETFVYTANGTAVTEWWLYVGTSEGAADLHDSNSLGTATSHEVSGLPTDSSPVHVRLWYKVAGTWLSRDFRYTAANSGG